jgi:hypothetical protein
MSNIDYMGTPFRNGLENARVPGHGLSREILRCLLKCEKKMHGFDPETIRQDFI